MRSGVMYIIKVVSGGKRRSGSTLGKQDWGVFGSFLLSIYPLGFPKFRFPCSHSTIFFSLLSPLALSILSVEGDRTGLAKLKPLSVLNLTSPSRRPSTEILCLPVEVNLCLLLTHLMVWSSASRLNCCRNSMQGTS